ncbi:carboxymuconolactone decarboxylase family protein [Pseudomonas fluorescens]|uniref:carboxymuconolactone decarboxylase family protein n=1 Tax=Pseudomonas fluorescens TaxID=294 RepID=UPI003747984A
MKPLFCFFLTICFSGYLYAQPETPPESNATTAGSEQPRPARPSGPLQQKLAPGLADYTDKVLFGEVWPGSGFSPRDRSLVVISILIATNKPAQLKGHLNRALANGVTPVEASGVLTHLAFYAGWPSAVSALQVYDDVYTARHIDMAALGVDLPMLAPDSSLHAGSTLPGTTPEKPVLAPRFEDISNRVVYGDLWRRSDLSVRDRSLVTIVALSAMGDSELIEPYLRRGIDAGLTRNDIGEALTQMAFYAGWGKAEKAIAATSQMLDDQP